MKHHFNILPALALCLLTTTFVPVDAQVAPPRGRDAFRLQFRKTWDISLPDPVKLVETGAVTDPKRDNLLMVVGGKDASDLKRTLLVTHWDGFRFVTDDSAEFTGAAMDTLLFGRFHTSQLPVVKPATATKPASNKAANAIITTESVFEWNGKKLGRICLAPQIATMGLLGSQGSDQMLVGSGNTAALFEVTDTSNGPIVARSLTSNGGYVRSGIGLQELPTAGVTETEPGTRFAQSAWDNQNHWFITVVRGKTPAAAVGGISTTVGDQIVVSVPRMALRDKPFLMLRPGDFEETWRSDPLPGRVLDVRVGDPKNDRKEGVLVLTAENGDKDRHLYFYLPSVGGR